MREAWSWDATQPVAAPALAPAEVQRLADDIAQLQRRRTDIRTRVSLEADIQKRQQLYADLHAVGLQLSPLERRRAALAARPLPVVQ